MKCTFDLILRAGCTLGVAISLLLAPMSGRAEGNASADGESHEEIMVETGGKVSRNQRKMTAKLRKKELAAENLPALEEIRKLKWEAISDWAGLDESKKVSLQRIFKQTMSNSINVRQAEVQVNDAENHLRELRAPNLMNLLNPLDAVHMKKAAEHNVQAAKAQLQAARQKALLESARLHADLVQSFLGKYLAYQAIEQGRNQLKVDQQRFVAGETTRFDVTLTQMALIDRYGKYLGADNTYQAASLAMSGNIGAEHGTALIPEDVVLQDGDASVTLLTLLPEDLTLPQVLSSARTRPELQVISLRRQALAQLLKAPFIPDRQKKEVELRQMDLEAEKAVQAGQVMAEKAFYDYRLSGRNLALASQRYELANQFMHQLNVSYEAGFSSLKDVLDGQVEWARAKAGLISAQVLYNLSQIQLVYEMGLLGEEIHERPLTLPPNIL